MKPVYSPTSSERAVITTINPEFYATLSQLSAKLLAERRALLTCFTEYSTLLLYANQASLLSDQACFSAAGA